MKKKYFYPVTETLKVQNLPIEMDASIESSSAAKLNQLTVSEDNGFPMSVPRAL